MKYFIIVTIFLCTCLDSRAYAAGPDSATDKRKGELTFDNKKEPTYIKSDKLILKSKERVFTYSGSVQVKQGDMTMYCETLDGKYNEKNQLEELIGRTNVLITKGDTVRATGQKAVYTQATDSMVLTENPELTQNGSVMSADSVTLHLKDNTSNAEGNVRVKMIKEEKKDDKKGFKIK